MELRERPPRHKALFDWKPLSANSLMRRAGSNSLQIPSDRKCYLCPRNVTYVSGTDLDLFGRGSWIRTNDLQYPKLPRYQAALYPD
jgi:hypothetical protein